MPARVVSAWKTKEIDHNKLKKQMILDVQKAKEADEEKKEGKKSVKEMKETKRKIKKERKKRRKKERKKEKGFFLSLFTSICCWLSD